MNSSWPLGPSSRHSLGDLDVVLIGRGSLSAERRTDAVGRTLRLTEPDTRVSTSHARIRNVLERWVLEDLDSKNGTLLDGERIQSAALGDGDLIEIGRTFFLFREAMPTGREEPLDLVFDEEALPGMGTLNAPFARELRALAAVARSTVSVVLQGETGTGKELLARAVHGLSGRSGPFVPVNCGAIPETLVESELFGVRRGAYSDAKEDRLGLIRSAHRGTLFLDEIGDLKMSIQPAFLRVLQEGEVVPIGQSHGVPVDVRVITASHRNIEKLASSGQFRQDLYARLSGFTITLPPLRSRREDLGVLIATLIRKLAPESAGLTFHPDAMRLLLRHRWPRNVRELEKRLAAAIALRQGGSIQPQHLGDLAEAIGSPGTRPEPGDEKKAALEKLLVSYRGNLAAVARALGKDRVQIRRWLKHYGIDPGTFRV